MGEGQRPSSRSVVLSPASTDRSIIVEDENVNDSCFSNLISPDDSISQTNSCTSGRTASVISKVRRNLIEPLAAELQESLSAVVELIPIKSTRI